MSRIPPGNPGARALRTWLDANGLNIPKFAEKYGIERGAVQRVMTATKLRMSVNLAMAIETATGGAVPIEVWSSAPNPADESGQLPVDGADVEAATG